MKLRTWTALCALIVIAACAPAQTAQPPALSQASGTARFCDKLATADQFSIQLSGVGAAPQGQVYQGWLIADDGAATNVGALTPASDGTAKLEWSSPNVGCVRRAA